MKSKSKSKTTTKTAATSPIVLRRLNELERKIASLDELVMAMTDKISELMPAAELPTDGDAGIAGEPAASDAGEGAGEPAEQSS